MLGRCSVQLWAHCQIRLWLTTRYSGSESYFLVAFWRQSLLYWSVTVLQSNSGNTDLANVNCECSQAADVPCTKGQLRGFYRAGVYILSACCAFAKILARRNRQLNLFHSLARTVLHGKGRNLCMHLNLFMILPYFILLGKYPSSWPCTFTNSTPIAFVAFQGGASKDTTALTASGIDQDDLNKNTIGVRSRKRLFNRNSGHFIRINKTGNVDGMGLKSDANGKLGHIGFKLTLWLRNCRNAPRAVTSILSPRLLHKMTNSKQFTQLVFAFVYLHVAAKKLNALSRYLMTR